MGGLGRFDAFKDKREEGRRVEKLSSNTALHENFGSLNKR